MNKSEQINELAAALSKAQGAMSHAAKDSANPFFKSKYSDLASVWDACRAALSANGLSVSQAVESGDNGKVTVNTVLMHSSGQWLSGELSMIPVKADPQGIGSAATYARRYALSAIVGVSPDDDDGNAASGRPSVPVTTQAIPLPPKMDTAPDPFRGVDERLSAVDKVLLDAAAEPGPAGPVFINLNKQRYLHRTFRESLPDALQAKADDFLKDFLRVKGGLLKDGKPSTKGILDADFPAVTEEAVTFAKSLGGA